MKRAAIPLACVLAMPAAAQAQAPIPGQPPPSQPPAQQQPAPQQQAPEGGKLTLRVISGIAENGKRYVARGQRVLVRGRVQPFVAGERYVVELRRKGKVVASETVEASQDGGAGKFAVGFRIARKGAHTVRARHDGTSAQAAMSSKRRALRALSGGVSRRAERVRVRLLQRGLKRLGFVTPRHGSFDDATGRAVLAYRKTNKMARTKRANPTVFRMLLRGAGGYRLKYPKAGKHVEYDISRQVLVLARGGKPERVYHSSSGAAATPTVLGSFRFYRKSPGTNAKGMVHSSYFIRGYAIHGFASVPTHPASHGCLRVPIPNALSIYRWIDLGDRIFVYR